MLNPAFHLADLFSLKSGMELFIVTAKIRSLFLVDWNGYWESFNAETLPQLPDKLNTFCFVSCIIII
jgi:hypothetical protein